MVDKDQVLLELDPIDENRSVEAAQANMDRANSALEKTKIILDRSDNCSRIFFEMPATVKNEYHQLQIGINRSAQNPGHDVNIKRSGLITGSAIWKIDSW